MPALPPATLHLTTQGVGREELLQHLAGRGDIRVRNVEFRGWDVSASVADGEPRTGQSRWAAGEGAFTLRDRGIVLAGLRLESGRELTFVKGTVSFGRDADLTVQTSTDGRRESPRLRNQPRAEDFRSAGCAACVGGANADAPARGLRTVRSFGDS